jgi:pyruvate,water dikinase
MAWVYYDALLAVPPANLNRSLGGYQPEIPITRESMLNANGRRRSATRMRMWRVFREFDRTGEERIRAVYEKIDRWSRLALQALSNHELLQHLQDVMNEGVAFAPASMCANASAGVWLDMPDKLLEKVVRGRGRALTAGLMAGSGGVVSADHGFRLYDLARVTQQEEAARAYLLSEPVDPQGWKDLPPASPFRAAFREFLREFGHRAVYEVDVMTPRWSEDPTYLLDQILALMTMARYPIQGMRRGAAGRQQRPS